MALLDITPIAPRLSIRAALAQLAGVFGRTEHIADPTDAVRRDFVLETLRENSDAVRSEADFQCMMSVYPGRF